MARAVATERTTKRQVVSATTDRVRHERLGQTDFETSSGLPRAMELETRYLRLTEMIPASNNTVCRKGQLASCNQVASRFKITLRKALMLKVATVLSICLTTTGARAAVPERVVVIDAVELTPALEKTNARQRMKEGVMAAVSAHGWDPVASTGDCHDFTCVGLAAADAGARYALILSGRFVEGPLYATEVSASLWHDGSVIARRTEADEQAEFDRVGRWDLLRVWAAQRHLHDAPAHDQAAAVRRSAPRRRGGGDPSARHGGRSPRSQSRARTGGHGGAAHFGVDRPEGRWGRAARRLVSHRWRASSSAPAAWCCGRTTTLAPAVTMSPARAAGKPGTPRTAAALIGGIGAAAAIAGVVVLVLDRGPSRVALSASPGGLAVGGLF